MSNNLQNETSPYLSQHKDNPVNWYPWGEAAFKKAKKENKPIFLSIGYSTCHWCHVMARESFEDTETAELLNKYFVAVKVDKEERPDIDNVYMSVCQTMTGSGGWPLSLFITPSQKPFYAGTYFTRNAFQNLLKQIHLLWQSNRDKLISSGNDLINALNSETDKNGELSNLLIDNAFNQLKQSFDEQYGGFGYAPKFPMPHNLIFLLNYYNKTKNQTALDMTERTLMQMYKGGIFDHIGYGFSRYSTDQYYLIPHFEKMLYDNALLIISYITAYAATNKEIYKEIAENTAQYIMREMTNEQGGFFSAQDADSEGEEGKYYSFEFSEIPNLIGNNVGKEFNEYYGITEKGNFEGKSIPNLLHNSKQSNKFRDYLPQIYEYRKSRTRLHLDDKVLTSCNSLMIAAFAVMHRILGDKKYLTAAKNACTFIEENLTQGDTLYVSYRRGRQNNIGFLDDYAFYIFALIQLYETSFEKKYLDRAIELCNKAIKEFFDNEKGGFYIYGSSNEQLMLKPKEVYDGAIPSGNSVMAYNLVMISQITEDKHFDSITEQQLMFMAGKAKTYPMGYCFYLYALSQHLNPPSHIVCALADKHQPFPIDSVIRIINGGDKTYPLINQKTTYYVCKNKNCLPPANDLNEVI